MQVVAGVLANNSKLTRNKKISGNLRNLWQKNRALAAERRVLLFLRLEFFLDLLDIHSLHNRLEVLNLEGRAATGSLRLVFAVLALESG